MRFIVFQTEPFFWSRSMLSNLCRTLLQTGHDCSGTAHTARFPFIIPSHMKKVHGQSVQSITREKDTNDSYKFYEFSPLSAYTKGEEEKGM